MWNYFFVDSPTRATLAICAFGCLDELVPAPVRVNHFNTHVRRLRLPTRPLANRDGSRLQLEVSDKKVLVIDAVNACDRTMGHGKQ